MVARVVFECSQCVFLFRPIGSFDQRKKTSITVVPDGHARQCHVTVLLGALFHDGIPFIVLLCIDMVRGQHHTVFQCAVGCIVLFFVSSVHGKFCDYNRPPLDQSRSFRTNHFFILFCLGTSLRGCFVDNGQCWWRRTQMDKTHVSFGSIWCCTLGRRTRR